MNSERVDQILRRASDDVRATVVRHSVPPPIESLGDRGHPIRRSVLGVAAATVTVSLGLAIVGNRGTTPVEAPGSTIALEVPPAAAGFDDLCSRVVDIAGVLADRPDDTGTWVALGDELDVLATRLDRSRSGLDEDSTRRYDRFIALTDQAVSLGAEGGYTPAEVRADTAVAVAQELVEFVAVPGCELRLPRSNDEEDPG